MTSNRVPHRRVVTPSSINPHPKQIISLEEWESITPLGEIQLKSINALKSATEKVPLPLKFSLEEGPASRPSTPVLLSHSRPSTPTHRLPSSHHSLYPTQPIQTPQQFYDWFALIDRSVAHFQESHFRAHVASVTEHLETCDRLVEKIDEVEREVGEMMEGWRSVEEGGRSLKDACERLLQERVRPFCPCAYRNNTANPYCIGSSIRINRRHHRPPLLLL